MELQLSHSSNTEKKVWYFVARKGPLLYQRSETFLCLSPGDHNRQKDAKVVSLFVLCITLSYLRCEVLSYTLCKDSGPDGCYS